jgi:hypothetical protein
MEFPLILAGVYIVVMPIVFRLIALAHKKLVTDRKLEKLNKKTPFEDLPQPIWPIWKERISYTIKDKRVLSLKKQKETKPGEEPNGGIQHRVVFLLIWLTGLLTTFVGTVVNMWQMIVAGFIIFFFAMGFGIAASKSIVEYRKNIVRRMYNLAKVKLGVSAKYENQPEAVVRILEWADPLKPNKVQFSNIPESFPAEGEEGFLRQYNQLFGQETAWVPFVDPETGEGGWDYAKGVVTLRAVPPLPQYAEWNENYVLSDGVAWSFFPIALGVENGLQLPNPETGEIENVLGFDLSGKQEKAAKQHGLQLGEEVTTSPMVFVGGGTGGGKSWDSNTLIEVLNDNKTPSQS